ncbi:response regulator transcription factor [Catenulispora rubra]|uniref:response regulator transcription factor n=1 Tax=Catenulispora rubra TaxID=280293 RepID=UPI0018925AF7|nr:response regulator transcription factor [Catenulispora rubra]
MRILVVEDEEYLARVLEMGLRREAMTVDVEHDGAQALARLAVQDYDAVVLDRDLPGLHGDEVCRRLVGMDPGCRILMLTAAGRLGDKVEGLGLGADDYLTKPFDFPELVARLRALYRRGPVLHAPVLAFEDLAFDTHRRHVTRAGSEIRLAPKELAVLELLLRADRGVVTTEELLDNAWDDLADPGANAVRLVVHTLRKKLGEPQLVQTVVNSGYRLGRA